MQWSDRIGRHLKPRDLHVFLAVAEQGNISKAAEELAISRPVVSRTIAGLERILGVPLFDRTGQGVEPTLYGRALAKSSVAVFDDLKRSVEEIEFLADPDAGELRVGITELTAAGLVPAAIDRLSRRHRRMIVRTEQGSATDVLGHLRERRCEVAVTRLFTAPEPDLQADPLHYEKLFIVVGARSKWARYRTISLKDLADEPWILAPQEMEPDSPTLEAFRALGLEGPRVVVLSHSLNLRFSLLATGRFVTMMPDTALRYGTSRAAIRVLPIQLPRWHRPTCVVTLKDRALSPLAQLFVKCLHEVAKPLAARGPEQAAH